MGHHLTKDGKFKSNKYDWCPKGYFALSFDDPLAIDAILDYAMRTQDIELSDDLRIACQNTIKEGNKK